MFKSIKDNNYINFEKLPDNFNFESNAIQKLKQIDEKNRLDQFKKFMITFFGDESQLKMYKYDFDYKDQIEIGLCSNLFEHFLLNVRSSGRRSSTIGCV